MRRVKAMVVVAGVMVVLGAGCGGTDSKVPLDSRNGDVQSGDSSLPSDTREQELPGADSVWPDAGELTDAPSEMPDVRADDADATGDVMDGGDDTGGCIDVYPGQVIITEIMDQPQSGPAYVELYNTGTSALQMKGWTLTDGAGNAASMALPAGVQFAAKEHLVVLFGESGEAPFEAPLLMTGLDLSTRELFFVAANLEVDRVAWTEEWPSAPGVAMTLDPDKYNLSFNDSAASWCPALTPYADGDAGSPGVLNADCPVVEQCGNGEVEGEEACDDGKNGDDEDGCTDGCAFSCVDPATQCQETPGDCQVPACVANELGQVCGAETDDTDVPDDGNPCTTGTCAEGTPGNSPVDDGSPCDNGAGGGGDYCVEGTCVEAECGDGVKGPNEGCDDGNLQPGDGCSETCHLEACGNGQLDPEEACDDGADGDDEDGCTDLCSFTCTLAAADCADSPGDCHVPLCVENEVGQVCGEMVQDLDVPKDFNPCTADSCALGVPTNGPLPDGTACDNGIAQLGDYCVNAVCVEAECGDGLKGNQEACDDGNEDECDGCLSNCTEHTPYCGDGILCGAEECDDGNQQDGDGCSAACQKEQGAGCPADMIELPPSPALGLAQGFCIDRYEASRSDATASLPGTDNSIAVSQPGVIPWISNPMSLDVLATYQAACEAADKRLCTSKEWFFSCTGTEQTLYSWGNSWDPMVCNSVDYCCPGYCEDNGIPEESCIVSANCGYTYYCFQAMPTGALADCASTFGAYDINGNAWEVVPSTVDPRGYEVRGGAFNCAAASTRLQCSFNAGWTTLYAGFRCCRDLEE